MEVLQFVIVLCLIELGVQFEIKRLKITIANPASSGGHPGITINSRTIQNR